MKKSEIKKEIQALKMLRGIAFTKQDYKLITMEIIALEKKLK